MDLWRRCAENGIVRRRERRGGGGALSQKLKRNQINRNKVGKSQLHPGEYWADGSEKAGQRLCGRQAEAMFVGIAGIRICEYMCVYVPAGGEIILPYMWG